MEDLDENNFSLI